MRLDRYPVVNRLGKVAAFPLSAIAATRLLRPLLRAAEVYLGILLGKGAGSGWAMLSEARAASRVIRRPRPVVFDVGAGCGEWSRALLKFKPDARLFLFEPQPERVEKLRGGELGGAVVLPKALSSSQGCAVLQVPEGGGGIASFHKRRDSYFAHIRFSETTVQTTTIDAVVRDWALPQIDFLKMDVEGHEMEVLKGAENALNHQQIGALSFEFGSGNLNSRTFFKDFWDLLVPFGFDIYRILPCSEVIRIWEYDEDCEYFRGVTNYIAVRHEQHLPFG